MKTACKKRQFRAVLMSCLAGLLGLESASAGFYQRNFPNEELQVLDERALRRASEFNVGMILPKRCPGTLISNRHVLVAAHCISNKEDRWIPNGDQSFLFYLNGLGATRVFVERIIPKNTPRLPPKLKDGLNYDILKADYAILEIQISLPMSKKIEIGMEEASLLKNAVGTVGFPVLPEYGQVALFDICQVTNKMVGPLYYSNCSFGGGSSGGPVFSLKEDTIVIGGILIADKLPNSPETRVQYSQEVATVGLMFLSQSEDTKWLRNFLGE